MNMNTALIVIVLFAVALGLFYFTQKQNSANKMDPQTFKQKYEQDSGIIIDVRTSQEFADGHLKKATHNWDVMSGEFQGKLASLDKEETYYLYCRSGNRSGKATSIMKQKDFHNVYNIGAYQTLINAGLESTK